MSQPKDAGEAAPMAAPLTAGRILEGAGAQLDALPGGDGELTKILKTHILIEASAKDAADVALKAIVALAEVRAKGQVQAKPTEAGPANG